MPLSMKQLDQRYRGVCDNIKDAKDYTLKHLGLKSKLTYKNFILHLDKQILKKLNAV